jgi:lysozyme
MKYNTSNFLDKLIEHEGMVLTVYKDTLGIDTIGIGRNLKDRGISKEELNYMDYPSIEAVYQHGLTEADARYLAMNDIKIVENELCAVHKCVEDLDGVRQLILMDMAFNMGVPRLCKFKKMWNAIHEKKFEAASLEMMDSKWARQVGQRAKKLSEAMKLGEF